MTQDLPESRTLCFMEICYNPILEVMGNSLNCLFDKPLATSNGVCMFACVCIHLLTHQLVFFFFFKEKELLTCWSLSIQCSESCAILQTVQLEHLWSSTQPVLHPRGGVGFWGDRLTGFWEHLLNNELYLEALSYFLEVILIIFVTLVFRRHLGPVVICRCFLHIESYQKSDPQGEKLHFVL